MVPRNSHGMMYCENFSHAGVSLVIVSNGKAVTEIFRGSTPEELPDSITTEASCQLKEYFGKCRKSFDFPIELSCTPGATPFRLRVWEALRGITYGETVTYGELASAVGCVGGARAVGGAVGANPILIAVPCHRVVAKDNIGGFSAGLDLKRLLLEIEGIKY